LKIRRVVGAAERSGPHVVDVEGGAAAVSAAVVIAVEDGGTQRRVHDASFA
jgi:hypothetical protein